MRKLMWFSMGFAAACLASVYLLPEPWLPWAALAAGLGGVCLLLGRGRRGRMGSPAGRAGGASPRWRALLPRRLLCAALGLALGLVWCLGYWALVLSPAHRAEGDHKGLRAQLCAWPTEAWNSLRVDALAELPWGRVRVRLYLYGEAPALEPGDWITGDFRLRRADLDADGDQRLELQAKGIHLLGYGTLQGYARGGDALRWLPLRLSRRVFQRLGELIPADAAGLPQAMLTADRAGLSRAQRQDLSEAGVSHIIAVSGLHVTMLLGVLILLTGRGLSSILLGIPLLGLFVLMTGASPSVCRAAFMLSLLLASRLGRGERDSPTALGAAALVLLLQNPWAAADLSFQLSFGAVAGLLLAAAPLDRWLLRRRAVRPLLRWRGPKALSSKLRPLLVLPLRVLLRGLSGAISATLSALVFTLPLSALRFGYLPVYSLLSNLPILPLATLCLWGSLLVLGLGALSTGLGLWAGRALAWPIRLLLGIARTVARLPGSLLWLDGLGLGFLALAYGLMLLALLRKGPGYGWLLPGLGAALALAVTVQSLRTRSVPLVLSALDVGQGQCVCMLSRDFAAMVDCGASGSDYPGTQAAQYLRRKDRQRLDALILSHYDTDHVSGVPALLELVEVDTLYLPQVDFDPENRAMVEAAAQAAGTELRYVTEDECLAFPGGSLRLFAPRSLGNDNAACVSVLYSWGEYDMLVTGDLDAKGEAALAAEQVLPPVELYVAGHHGSKTASSAALLAAIRPQTVFISVGRNHYGLPSPEVLDRLEAAGAEVYRTDLYGNLEIIGR